MLKVSPPKASPAPREVGLFMPYVRSGTLMRLDPVLHVRPTRDQHRSGKIFNQTCRDQFMRLRRSWNLILLFFNSILRRMLTMRKDDTQKPFEIPMKDQTELTQCVERLCSVSAKMDAIMSSFTAIFDNNFYSIELTNIVRYLHYSFLSDLTLRT